MDVAMDEFEGHRILRIVSLFDAVVIFVPSCRESSPAAKAVLKQPVDHILQRRNRRLVNL